MDDPADPAEKELRRIGSQGACHIQSIFSSGVTQSIDRNCSFLLCPRRTGTASLGIGRHSQLLPASCYIRAACFCTAKAPTTAFYSNGKIMFRICWLRAVTGVFLRDVLATVLQRKWSASKISGEFAPGQFGALHCNCSQGRFRNG